MKSERQNPALLPGTLTELTIRDLGESGEGIGQLENGLTCFGPGLLPGENGKIRLDLVKKNYATGRLLERRTVSPDRVKAPCTVFEDCGGCQIMDLSYPAQLELKRKQTAEALARIA